jgi:hypothetical protein
MFNVAVLVLALLPALVIGLALIGSLLRYAVRRALRAPASPATSWTTATVRVTEDVGLGVTVVVLAYVAAGALGIPLGAGFAFGLLALAVAVFAVRYLADRESIGVPFPRTSKPALLGAGLLVGLLAVVLATRILPYTSFVVYSGNDVRVFSLITELVEAHGGLVSSWGSFAGPTWNVATDPHLVFAGPSAVFAFLNAWVPWSTPQLVSAAAISFNVLIPFSAYGFFRRLFPTQPPLAPLLGALTLGVLASYPINFLQWGGLDETLGWFLFPTALSLLLQYLHGESRKVLPLLLGGLAFGALIAVSPLEFFYTLAFLLAYVLGILLTRAAFVRPFVSVVSFLAVAFVAASPVIYHEASGWLHYNSAVPPGYAGWGTFQNSVILEPGNVVGSLVRFWTLLIPIPYVLFVTLTGWAGLVLYFRKEAAVITLVVWIAILLVMNTDGPFGLFWVQYPFWTFLYPDRTAHMIFIPLSAGSGLLLTRLISLRWPGASALPATPAPWRALPPRRRVTISVILIVVLVSGAGCAYQVALNNSNAVAWGNSLTTSDLTAFTWMKANVPAHATVLVNAADSGTWIPEFTGLRVFPYANLINNPSVYDQTLRVPVDFNTTNYTSALQLMGEYNLSYVFFGARVQYSFSQQLTLAEFTQASPIGAFIAHEALCSPSGSDTTVWLRCSSDSVGFHGPVLLNLTEFHNGSRIGSEWVGVPDATEWDPTLQTNTSSFPGNWSFEIASVPIAPVLFAAGTSKLLYFNPVFQELEMDTGTVLQVPQDGPLPQE